MIPFHPAVPYPSLLLATSFDFLSFSLFGFLLDTLFLSLNAGILRRDSGLFAVAINESKHSLHQVSQSDFD